MNAQKSRPRWFVALGILLGTTLVALGGAGAVYLYTVGTANASPVVSASSEPEATPAPAPSSTVNEDYNIHYTAEDETAFLAKLARNELPISTAGRIRWLNAMKNNVHREGIPAGIPNAVVADKVGFQDELHRDAAIVYSPKGTYVLVIMTSDADWDEIAGLAAVIEAAR